MKKEMLTLLLCFILCFLCINGCFEDVSSVGPIMIYVDSDGGADYSRIQDAIDAADINGIIFVSNGTYYETLTINKSLTLIGSSKDNTTIAYDRNKSNHVDIVCINADNCTFKCFKIVNTNSSTDISGITINSVNNTISDTSILYTIEGICIEAESTNNFVLHNNITKNAYGVNIKYAASHNYISNNVIAANTLYGIYLRAGSRKNIISWNNISHNEYGIRLKSATNNKIFGNTIINNQRGMYFCCGAQGNVIYYNEFINNGEWNAKDTERNAWNNETVGNYWDNYKGIDSDNDGISETCYSILGGNNRDNYPLMNPGLK